MVLVASLKVILWAAIKSLEASRHHGGDVSPPTTVTLHQTAVTNPMFDFLSDSSLTGKVASHGVHTASSDATVCSS